MESSFEPDPRSAVTLEPHQSALGRVAAVLRRVPRFWKTSAIVSVALAALAVALLPRIMPPVYRSETVLVYREGIQATSMNRGESADQSRKLGPRLKDMLLARTRLERLIGEFHLYPATVQKDGMVDAVEELRKHIDFKAREGDTFHISFDGESPETTQAVTTRLAEGLVEENSRLKAAQAGATKEFLDEEKKRNDEDMHNRERALAIFLSQHPEFADEAGGKGGPSAGASVRAAEKKERDQKTGVGVGVGSSALAVLERQAYRLRTQLRSPSAPPPPPVMQKSPVDPKLLAARQEAEAQLASAQKDLADKQARFTDQHPDVVAARGRVAAAQGKLTRAVEAVSAADKSTVAEPYAEAATEDQRPALEAQLTRIENQIAQLKGGAARQSVAGAAAAEDAAANGIVALETQWSRLNRDVLEARERGQQLLDRLFRASMEASVESSGGAAQMVVVDPAFRPVRPFSFGKNRVIAFGVLGALIIGLLVALLRAALDDRVYDAFDVERLDVSKLVLFIPAPAGAHGGKRVR